MALAVELDLDRRDLVAEDEAGCGVDELREDARRPLAGAVPEYVIVSFGAPSTSAVLAKLTLTSTPLVARAGVMPPAMLPSTAVGAPATGSAGANVVGTNARSPAPCALIAGPDAGGYVSATSSAPFWSTVANAGPSCADVSPFT